MSKYIFHSYQEPADSKYGIPHTTQVMTQTCPTFINNTVYNRLRTSMKVFQGINSPLHDVQGIQIVWVRDEIGAKPLEKIRCAQRTDEHLQVGINIIALSGP
jgi:hypothetical protein